jgi:hypothetical protein
MKERTMSEWKSWSKQFERDMREAAEGVREAFASGDPHDIAEGAAEFAQTIVECAVTPVAAFLGGLPRAMDLGSWKGARAWSRGAWDDEA